MEAIKIYFDGRLEIIVGDITELAVDAIVNAANSSLLGGVGVDGSIHRKAGRELIAECRMIRATIHPDGLPTGEAVITRGYNLPARFVIHTVGPVWNASRSDNEFLLGNCYLNSLMVAKDNKCSTIAFPAISTGVYGYPKEKAAPVALDAARQCIASNALPQKIIFVFFNKTDAEIFIKNAVPHDNIQRS